MSSGLTTLSASHSLPGFSLGARGFFAIDNRFNGLLRDEPSLFGAVVETVKTVPHSKCATDPS